MSAAASALPFHHKIGLIIPPSPFLLDERVFVSLGVLKVAAALEERGCAVDVLDVSGLENYLEAIKLYCETTENTVVGITATTPQMPSVKKIAELIRAAAPHLRLILGGPHATLTFAAKKLEVQSNRTNGGRAVAAANQLQALFDVIVVGDGELAVFEALHEFPPAVVDADDRSSPFFMSNAVYKDTPPPARHLIDLPSYHYQIDGGAATSLIAQLGCPFSCGFCGGRHSPSLRITRNRPPQSVLSEVEFLHGHYGYTGFMFYDDELNVSSTFVELMNGLTALQERLGTEFFLRGFVKSELLTNAQAKAMHRAGFRWLLCGYEAANERILLNINKRATKDDNTRAVEIAKNNGLKIKALMSIGHPGESEQTTVDIKDWLIDMEVDDFDCTIITTYPGTPYYDQAVPFDAAKNTWLYTQPATGDRLYSTEIDFMTTADFYKGDPAGGYEAFVFTDHASAADLVRFRDTIEGDVRRALNIPFNPSRPAVRFEHSMGQGLPASVLMPR